jgi:hypothetical protein
MLSQLTEPDMNLPIANCPLSWLMAVATPPRDPNNNDDDDEEDEGDEDEDREPAVIREPDPDE